MAKRELPMKGGEEYDALTRWRHYLRWRPGERVRVKHKYNKRVRSTVKRQLKLEEG